MQAAIKEVLHAAIILTYSGLCDSCFGNFEMKVNSVYDCMILIART